MRKVIALIYREMWLLRYMWYGGQALTFYDEKGKVIALAAVLRHGGRDIRFKSFYRRKEL